MNCNRNQKIVLIVGASLLTCALLIAPYKSTTLMAKDGNSFAVIDHGPYGFSLKPPKSERTAVGGGVMNSVFQIDLTRFSIPIAIIVVWTGIAYVLVGDSGGVPLAVKRQS